MNTRIENKMLLAAGLLGLLFVTSKLGRGIFRELFQELAQAAGRSAERTRAAGIAATVEKLVAKSVSHPQRVTIEVESGVVTLRGNIGAVEVRNLVGAIENLPGVVQVIDQLNVPDPNSRYTKRELLT